MPSYTMQEWHHDWFSETGRAPTPRVVTNVPSFEDASNDWARGRIASRSATATNLIGPGVTLAGGSTKRAKVTTDGYRESLVYILATSAVSSPDVKVRFYLAGDESLQADDDALHADYIEMLFPEYIGEDPTYSTAKVSDGTDPSASILAALTPVLYRGLGFQLMTGTTAVDAGLEDTDGTDLSPLFSFAANAGGVFPLIAQPQHYYFQTAAGKGVRIDKSAANTVHGFVQYRQNPLRLTAAGEYMLRFPPAKVLAVEITNTALAAGTLDFHIRHVGLT